MMYINRLGIFALALMFFASCGSNQTEEKENANLAVDDPIENIAQNADVVKDTTVKTATNADAPSKPIVLTEDDFAKKVFNYRTKGKWNYIGDKPCMVDFYADWCGPCRIIAPYMEEFAKTYKGKLYIYKVNTDKARELSGYFGINSIPAVMFCPMQGEYKMVIGANPKDQYVSLIETFLKVK